MLIFIAQLTVPAFTGYFVLISKDAMARSWILVTSIFLHGSTEHLLYNMLALALFGTILERIIGSKKFLFVFFFTGIAASIASTFFYDASLGASGAIFGLLGCLAVLRPKMQIWVMGVPMPMFVAVIVWLIIDLAGVFYPTNVANAAHVAGLIVGLIIGFVWRKKFYEYVQKRIKPKVVEEKELDSWENEWMK
jgi:membrane associated rhomboid family serine protease